MTLGAVVVTMTLLMIGAAIPAPASAYQSTMHQDLAEKALGVLANDNKSFASAYFAGVDDNGKKLKAWFLEGIYDCDRLDLARNHYYNPLTGKGLTEYNSLELCQDLYDEAVKLWKDGDYGKSMYYLGRATHMVMDSTVPHHGHLDPLNGHAEFETWLAEHEDEYAVTSGGIYSYSNITAFIDGNARTVYDYYYDIKSDNASEASYAMVAAIIEPLAIRTSAGFLVMFADEVQDTAPAFDITEIEGGEAILTWQPSTDRDFRAYRIYISEPGHAVVIGGDDLLREYTDRSDNTLTITKLAKYGTYQLQIVTVLANDTLESVVLDLKVGGSSKLIVVGAGIGIITVMAIGLTLSTTSKHKRRKT